MSDTIKIGIVAGEESGQLLAADIIDAILKKTGKDIELVGVGGAILQERGLRTLFDPDDIALMGVSAVVKSLPRLIIHISKTADALIAAKPHVIILVDSPDFSLRVAKKVKAAQPDLPVIKYVAPTVWAWRPQRAKAMAAYVDHVLALFPFEPAVMEELGGPKTTYVGHRLTNDPQLLDVRKTRKKRAPNDQFTLLLLPGSRKSEINALMPKMTAIVEDLRRRHDGLEVLIPTLERHGDLLRNHTAAWKHAPVISVTRDEQMDAFAKCDVAIAASGTVLLECSLTNVPVISLYCTDLVMKFAKSMLTGWTAALPNMIADKVVIHEYFDDAIRPPLVARLAETLADSKSARHKAIMQDYAGIQSIMKTHEPASKKAAEIVAGYLKA